MTAVEHAPATATRPVLDPDPPPECEWPCGCDDGGLAACRVWFNGCAMGCGGHLMCRRHASGKVTGVIRANDL